MRKLLLVLVILAIIPAALFAGGGGETTTTTSSALTKITAVLDIIVPPEDGMDQWAAAFKEITGVEIEITKPTHNQYSEILGITFASGDLPDICEIQTGDYVAYATSGKLVPLEDYIKASDAIDDVDKVYYESYRMRDGHIYAFPLNRGGGCVTFIRKDWLDKLGLSVPKNWDEFVAVCKAFTFQDPDGDGQNDTVGYTIPFDVPALEFDYYNRMIMQDAMFGFKVVNGKWVDGFAQPEMKAALQRFKDLYSAGIMDTEFFSNKTSAARSKIYEGQAGMMEYWSGTWGVTMYENTKNSSGPNAVVIPIAPIRNAHYINRTAVCFGITTSADNPEAVFNAFINTMLDKGEGQILFTYGVENVHWKTENSKMVMLPQISNPENTFTKAYVHPELTLNDWQLPVALDPRITATREIHVKYAEQLALPRGGNNYVKYIGDIMTLKQEIFSRIVVGDISIDAGLAEYANAVASLHMADILNELNM